MRWQTGIAKVAAFGIAVALHVAILQPWSEPERAMTEAGSGVALATLGTSFADMVAGTHQSRPLQTTISPNRPAQRVEAAELEATPAVPLAAALPVTQTHVRVSTPKPQVDTKASTISEPEYVTTGQTASLRPKMRPDLPRPSRQPAETVRDTSKQGQGARDAVRGSTPARNATPARTQGRSATKAPAAGSDAATNYPGLVMRHIARQRRPDLAVRGTAVIAFTIGLQGQLSTSQLARSSGSSALDRAALQIVRRAAPFPPPPEGARRSHSVGIKGRGL